MTVEYSITKAKGSRVFFLPLQQTEEIDSGEPQSTTNVLISTDKY